MIDIWSLVNQPLPVLLIGSGLGWLFLKFAWEPYQVRKTQNERAAKYRTEVEVRLADISYSLKKTYNAYNTHQAVMGSPTYNVFVSPEFRSASLFALIAGGWDPKMAQRCDKHIQGLVLGEELMENAATRQRAEETLSGVARDLGVTLPAVD